MISKVTPEVILYFVRLLREGGGGQLPMETRYTCVPPGNR